MGATHRSSRLSHFPFDDHFPLLFLPSARASPALDADYVSRQVGAGNLTFTPNVVIPSGAYAELYITAQVGPPRFFFLGERIFGACRHFRSVDTLPRTSLVPVYSVYSVFCNARLAAAGPSRSAAAYQPASPTAALRTQRSSIFG